MNIKDYNDLFTILTAIGTIGMCLCSFLNIRFTRKQVTYQSKIIDTKNLLYLILRLERNFILGKMQIYTKILECFVCLYMLKKEQIDKTTFKCYFEFENKLTTPDVKEKIKTCFSCSKPPAETPEKTYQYCEDLIEIIGLYFGKNNNFQVNLLNNFFCIIYSLLSKVVNDKQNTELFSNYLSDYEKYMDDINLYRHNKCFTKFYTPAYQKIVQSKQCCWNTMLQDEFEGFCCFFIDKYDKKMSYIEKYTMLHKRLKENFNDDVINAIISDFMEQKIYYLPEQNFVKKYFLKGKQRYYFWKIKSKFSYNKENLKKEPEYYKVSKSCIIDRQGERDILELKINSKTNI